MPGPLSGLRVVDCSWGMAGPRATGMMADYGADVIRVEPRGGDPWRDELAAPYSVYQRGKRSIVLDLHDPGDRATFFELLSTADVFVESWQPGVADRLGVGYDEVHRRVPGLVYCSISGFGATGPDADVPGYEPLIHAALGTMGDQAGHRDGPIFVGMPSASGGAAYLALIGVLASLYRRHTDGWGRHVETSLLDGMFAYVSQAWGTSERNRERYRTGGTRFLIKTLRCSDDEYVGVHTGAYGAFDRLMVLLGLDDRVVPIEGGSEASIPLTDVEEAALAELPDIFVTATRQEWLDRLMANRICGIPVLRPTEVFDEPQAIHNGMVVEVDDPVLGRVQQVAPPAVFGESPAAVRGPAPTAGQHQVEVLAELRDAPRVPAPSGPRDERPLLEGIKVLDVGHWFAGPFASRLLADLGADVIKLEPTQGDPMRGLERPFSTAQAGKRSIAGDLRDPAVQEIAADIVRSADIVHHNLRPGVAERLGVGFEQTQALNAGVIYVHATGWGAGGPNRDRQSFAPLMGGYVGAHYEAAGQYNPPVDPIANEDSGGGLLGAVSALMALLHRQRTGRGQFIDAPHFHSALADISHIVRRADDREVLGAERLDPLQYGFGPLERLYETADGWICIVAKTDDHVAALAKVLAAQELSQEPLRTRAGCEANEYDTERVLFDAIAARRTDELLAELRSAGVPAGVPKVQNNRPFMDDEHNLAIGRVGEYVHPRFGHTRESGVLMRLAGAQVPPHRRPPELAEHTDEILAGLGRTPEQIDALRQRGVIR